MLFFLGVVFIIPKVQAANRLATHRFNKHKMRKADTLFNFGVVFIINKFRSVYTQNCSDIRERSVFQILHTHAESRAKIKNGTTVRMCGNIAEKEQPPVGQKPRGAAEKAAVVAGQVNRARTNL